jgi:geranylgeranyl diphosphate synthase type II
MLQLRKKHEGWMHWIGALESEFPSNVRDKIDAQIHVFLCSRKGRVPEGLVDAMRQATLMGGKRLRALLVVGIVEALQGDVHNGICVGAAVEMVHSASLIIDDLPCMDNATDRRGNMALHLKIGEDGTILAALALVNLAYEVLASLRGIPVEAVVTMQADLASTLGRTGLVGGQWEDLKPSSSPPDIEYINLSKTGALFEFASRNGGVLCGANAVELDRLARFGRLFGIAYQMLDDLHDGELRRMHLLSGSADCVDQWVRALSQIRQVLKASEECARGSSWYAVARALICPKFEQINTLGGIAELRSGCMQR